MFSLTRTALEQFDNQHDFERMSSDILNGLGYTEVTPIAPRGGSDGGKDIEFTTESGGKGLACVTLRSSDIQRKFEEDFSKRKAGEYEKYILFCTAYLTAQQKRKFAMYCLEILEAEFRPFDIEVLRSLLDSTLKSIRENYLHIKNDSIGVREEDFAAFREEVERKNKADNLLLRANKFATSLTEKKELVEEAVELWPPYRQKECRELGLEMSAAIVDGFDHITDEYIRSMSSTFQALNSPMKLKKDEITLLTASAIHYLRETAFNMTSPDAQGLLYLACVYGYCQQYEAMMEVLDRGRPISQIVQDMKDEARERQMLPILLGACGSDRAKIEGLRKKLNLSRTTKTSFCRYLKEFPLITNLLPGNYIKWLAVRKREAPEESGKFIISITPPYPSNQRKVDAFFS